MQELMETVGWYAFLAGALAFASYGSKSFLSLVLDKGAQGEHVYFGDTLVTFGAAAYKKIAATKVASACAVAVLLLVGFVTDASAYATLGYTSIAYAIGGLATPFIMRSAHVIATSAAEESTAPAVVPATHPVAPATDQVVDS